MPTKKDKKQSKTSKVRIILSAYEKSANDILQNNQRSLRDVILETFTEDNDKSSVVFPDGVSPDQIFCYDDIELIYGREKDEELSAQIETELDSDSSPLSISLLCEEGEMKYVELLATSTPATPEIEEMAKECAKQIRELNDLYEKTLSNINQNFSELLNQQIEKHHENLAIEL